MGDILGAYLSILAGTLFFGLSAMNILTLKRGLVCAGEILSVIDREPPIDINKRNAIDTTGIFEDIKFENVSFSYQGRNKAALKNITLTFKYGETTALVGSSGWGKSTIVKLIERFYDPDEGRVIVNGKDLKTLNLQQYRRKVGYVGQEPCLLNESILDNLLNANPYATTSDIINALKAARAYDFVAKLPNGLNYEVGGVGTKLSGGQKQRIAIARELLKNPDVLILDEATSALDKENEKEVQKAIDNIDQYFNEFKIKVKRNKLVLIYFVKNKISKIVKNKKFK